MLSFSSVYITARVRASLDRILQVQRHKKFWRIVLRLKEGQFAIPGLKVEKLYLKGEETMFSARLSREMRLIFSMRRLESGNALIIHELNHHDEAYDHILRREFQGSLHDAKEFMEEQAVLENEWQTDSLSEEAAGRLADQLKAQSQLYRVPAYLLSDPDKYARFEKSLDRYLHLSEEQEEILSLKGKALLVQGPAGTGKTTLALFSALNTYEDNTDDSVFLFTYHDELACVCRAYKVNLLGTPDAGEADEGIKVLSYIDFCRRYLREILKKNDQALKLIGRQQSIDMLNQILSGKPRWSRVFSAGDLYGLIYSIFKGRFMPGTENLPSSKEDYERIFKDYGRTPAIPEEMLEIFAQYQGRLSRQGLLDEADVIRLSYDSLKRNALLTSANKRLWIVIDEVQDFTELELKSILLFWENHCRQHHGAPALPFVCGDTNQNISRSGFRWQELESYLQLILRKLHRPNALKKMALHRNYRNTLQIYRAAAFLRSFASDAGDLGLQPELEGDKPSLVVASDRDLALFLKEKEQGAQCSHPIVVLVESEESLRYLLKELAGSRTVFLLLLQASKGMEFEDVIIHRAFSSLANLSDLSAGCEASRLFDLWYMGITRACRNLLLVQNPEDRQRLDDLLAGRAADFFQLVEVKEAQAGLSEFWLKRKPQMPDYNVIFLQRNLAQQLWNNFLKEEAGGRLSDYGSQCKLKAIELFARCFDYSSLGRALRHLGDFSQAASFLLRADLLQEAAECLESGGEFLEAADLFEKVGLTSEAACCFAKGGDCARAANLYEECGSWSAAGENHERSGDLARAAAAFQKASLFDHAADIFMSLGDLKHAADLYVMAAEYLKAASAYLQIGDRLSAARCFQKAGKPENSVAHYEALASYASAAKAAEDAHLYEKAAQLNLLAGLLPEAARSYTLGQLPEKAAGLYEQIKDYSKAASAYEAAGLVEQAACMYEKCGDFARALELSSGGVNELLAARCLERLGDFHAAGELYRKRGDICEAAYCFERANEFEIAAELFSESKNFAQAAACLAKLDRTVEAARLYVVSGQISAAYELVSAARQGRGRAKDEEGFKLLLAWCLQTGKTGEAAQLLELKKDYRSAADKFIECMMPERAALCLEKSGQFKEAATLFRQAGKLERAAECFKQAKMWREAAVLFERLKKWAEAKAMYERLNDREGVTRCEAAFKWF